jgi:putative transposase
LAVTIQLKKINGRKRHILVDNNGSILKCYVGPANENDTTGAVKLFSASETGVNKIYADMGYTGYKLHDFLLNSYQIELQVIKRPRKYYYALPDSPPQYMEPGSKLLPKRWIVERSWL